MDYNVYFWRGEPDVGIKFCLGCEVIWAEGKDCKAEAFKMLKTDDYTFTEGDLNTFEMKEFPTMLDSSIEDATEYYRNGSTDIFVKKGMPKTTEWKDYEIDLATPKPSFIFNNNKEFFNKIVDATKCEALKKRLGKIIETIDCIEKR